MAQQLAKAAIPVHASVPAVFNAFVDPSLITQFWLQSTSGPLSKGAVVRWHFMVPGAEETVSVQDFEVNRRIAFVWSSGVKVAIEFAQHSSASTLVSVEASGFKSGDIEAIVNTTEGFSIVLCDLKTLLESGHSAGLVRAKAELIASARQSGRPSNEA